MLSFEQIKMVKVSMETRLNKSKFNTEDYFCTTHEHYNEQSLNWKLYINDI